MMDLDLLYLRKSRDRAELADPDVLHKHRRELLRLVGRPVPPENIYEEIGSGDTLRARPVCRAVLERIDRLPRSGGARLWTLEVARLTRGHLSDRARVQECLQRAAVIHCTRAADYDLRQTTDRLQWEIMTLMAAHELGVYKERVDAARLDMAREGRLPTGKPPWGWVWDRAARNDDGSKGRAEVDPLAFPVVQALCREALHLSTYALSRKYGLPADHICDLLRNPFVCGYPARRHFVHDGERKRRDNAEPWKGASAPAPRADWIWPSKPAGHVAACTRAEWEAIQSAMDERCKRRAKTTCPAGWCRDVVRFLGHEERARMSSIGSAGRRMLTYALSAPYGKANPIYLARDLVHAAADAQIRAILASPAAMRAGAAGYRRARIAQPADDTAAVRAEIARLERLLDALLDRELRALDAEDHRDLASIQRQRERYKADLATADLQLQSLLGSRPDNPHVDDLCRLLDALGTIDLSSVWETVDDTARQVVVLGFVDTIVCRVERLPSGHRWRREVERVELRPMWRPYFL